MPAIAASRRRQKARCAAQAIRFEDIPNVGPAAADDLRQLGFCRPSELAGADPYRLYEQLCTLQGDRLDPCVCDVMIAAVRFMDGEMARPWWEYTLERKRQLGLRRGQSEARRASAR